jgi:hypothetical protein
MSLRFPSTWSPSDKREFILTSCIALFTVINGVATAIYVREFSKSAKGAGEQTGHLIDAANIQSCAATKIAAASGEFTTSAKGIEAHLGDAVTDFRDAAKESARAAQVAAKNAETNIKSSQDSFRSEQRAWVGFQGTGQITGFTETEPMKIPITFFNSGRTPARNVQISAKFITSPVAITGPTEEFIGQLVFTPAQSIAPQGNYRPILGAEYLAETSTQEQRHGQEVLVSQYKAIKEKRVFLYLYGILKYDDIFGNHRQTQWCIFLANPDTKEIGVCDAFNDLN